MLMSSSPIYNRRLRRLGLASIALGLLLIAAAFGLQYWTTVQSTQARQEELQQVAFNPLKSHELNPPFMTAADAETVYAPGQTALAFAQNFKPHEPIFVRLYSRTQGLIAAYQTRADVRGQYAAARSLSPESDNENYTPVGGLWFQIEALSGVEQVFRFRLKPGHVSEPVATKGVYPATTIPGTVVAFWCSGMQTGDDPSLRIFADGQEFRDRRVKINTYPITSDGLLLGTVVVSMDDPTGEWSLYVNHCLLSFTVQSSLNHDLQKQGSGIDVDYTP